MSWPTQAAQTPQPEQTLSPVERDNLILAWRRAAEDLKATKEREMGLRISVTKTLFPTPKKGTQRFDLGSGYQVKLVHKINPSMEAIEAPDRCDAEGNTLSFIEQMYALADEIEGLGNEGKFLVDRLLKWSCDLSMSEYQKLDGNNPTHVKIKAAIDRHLVLKDASPSLELEEPKAAS